MQVSFYSDQKNGCKNQQIKSVSSSVVPTMGEHLDPNSQMELVGHSIVSISSFPLAFYMYKPSIHGNNHRNLNSRNLYPLPLKTCKFLVEKVLLFNLWFSFAVWGYA